MLVAKRRIEFIHMTSLDLFHQHFHFVNFYVSTIFFHMIRFLER